MEAPVDKKTGAAAANTWFLFVLQGVFTKFCAHTAEPLTALTRKGKPDKVLWDQSVQRAFDQLKANLTDATNTPLALIDCIKAFNLYVDTSN